MKERFKNLDLKIEPLPIIKRRTFKDLFEKCTMMITEMSGIFELSSVIHPGPYVFLSIFVTFHSNTLSLRSSMPLQFETKREMEDYIEKMANGREMTDKFVNLDLSVLADLLPLIKANTTKRKLEESDFHTLKGFEMLAGKSKKSYTSFMNFFDQYFAKSFKEVEQKQFCFWKDFFLVNRVAFEQHTLGSGSQLALGVRASPNGTPMKSKFDRVPPPTNDLIVWLKECSMLLRKSEIDTFIILRFYHTALFLKMINSDLHLHFLQTISHIRDEKYDLFNDNLLMAFLQRGIYFGGVDAIPISGEETLLKLHGLKNLVQSKIERNKQAFLPQDYPRFDTVENIAQQISEIISKNSNLDPESLIIKIDKLLCKNQELSQSAITLITGLVVSMLPIISKNSKNFKGKQPDVDYDDRYDLEQDLKKQFVESLPKCGNKCGKYGNKKCSKCKSVYYCSPECQKEHWKVHKTTCKEK